MSQKKIKILCLLLIGVFLITSGFGCKSPTGELKEYLKPITLEYWRVWDDDDAFEEIITAYKLIHPNVTINYRKFRYEEYEQALLEAWAEDRGPDIFSIHEGWLRKYQTKIEPMPAETKMAVQYTKSGIKKEIAYKLETRPTPTHREIKEIFADTVYNDIVIDGRVYGFPLSLETLIMFYNRDLLNQAGISQAPTDWNTFVEAVQKITRYNSQGNVARAGAAMGTGSNTNNSFDILSILMMQSGATMTNSRGYASFTSVDKGSDYNPGQKAIEFYTDFATPTQSSYTWDLTMDNSFASFLSGQVGMMFNYNHNLSSIRAQAPRLNLGIAPIPQVKPDSPVNYGSYWLETVSKKSAHTNQAWDFILYATKEANVKSYLDKTKSPTALKSLVNSQLEDEDLYAAATQILTASNWYIGKNQPATEEAFKEMIDTYLEATIDKEKEGIVNRAISKINQTVD
ncbi:MAG TPA: extracellular solute-binding protein [Patescibacteria group bacterium]|nr:extracellular solute-binding protein [Patescibacteria group bacterium]